MHFQPTAVPARTHIPTYWKHKRHERSLWLLVHMFHVYWCSSACTYALCFSKSCCVNYWFCVRLALLARGRDSRRAKKGSLECTGLYYGEEVAIISAEGQARNKKPAKGGDSLQFTQFWFVFFLQGWRRLLQIRHARLALAVAVVMAFAGPAYA